ncbi:MAG: hypothetical protein HZA94_03740 [Candidatus Vogelbacteria bacterium]|nr:hypothetical protein [Candidatus Vogelbacteria bacterium]
MLVYIRHWFLDLANFQRQQATKGGAMNKLTSVTLAGIDCINVERLQRALNISSQGLEFAKIKLLTSLRTKDSRRIRVPRIGSIESFSRFCVHDLYRYIDTRFVLLVQYDGFVINPDSWSDEFLEYDYIGAPWLVSSWSVRRHDFPTGLVGRLVVGNGGFSLRSKRFIEASARLAREGVFSRCHPEDVALCVWYRERLEKEGLKFAPPSVAVRFSIEGDNSYGYKNQFGFHDYSHRFRKPYLRKLMSKHPEWGMTTGR